MLTTLHWLCLAAISASPAPAPADSASDLTPLVDRIVQPHLANTVGLVVGVLQGPTRRVFCWGKLSDNSNLAPDADSLFEIGSITKTFTSLLLADMVQREEVKLEDPIRLYLPATVHVPSRNGKEIRLVDLATHASGLPRISPELVFAAIVSNNPYRYYTPEVLYHFLNSYELPCDIGAVWEYSNLGGGLLGHCLTRRASRSYEELVRERICRPLGMSSTCVTLTPELRKRMAPGHKTPGKPAGLWDFDALAGAGALRSSANDMLKYLAAQLGLVHSRPETQTAPSGDPGSLDAAIRLTHVVRRHTDSSDNDQALGWMFMRLPGGDHPILWHNGGTGGYQSWAGVVKESRTAVVVLSNCASPETADAIGFALVFTLDRQAATAPASQPAP